MIWRQAVVPAAAGCSLVLWVVLYAARHPAPRPAPPETLTRAGAAGLLRHLATVAAGGYAVLLLVVFVFSTLLVGDRRAFASAALGGAFLIAVSTPVFVMLSWLEGRSRGRRC